MTQRLPRQTGLAEARPVKYRRLPVPDVSTGGSAGPTFIINDYIGFKDVPTWAWNLPDAVGYKDAAMTWGLNPTDNIGFKDALAITGTMELSDRIGFKDTFLLGATELPVVRASGHAAFDSDAWGDSWVDRTAVTGVNVNHGAEATMTVANVAALGVTEATALVEIDFTRFAGWSGSTAGGLQSPDAGPGNYPGMLVGAPVPTLVASPFSGFGNALSFDGVNRGASSQGVDMGNTATGVPGVSGVGAAAAFCLEAKIKPASVSITQLIAGRYAGAGVGQRNVLLYLDATGHPKVDVACTDGLSSTVSATALTVNTTHDVAASYDGTTIRLFVDGAIVATDTRPGIEAPDATTRFFIGRADGVGFELPFNGIIDEVHWSKTSRHTAAYTPSASPATADANTLGLWHFDTLNTSTVPVASSLAFVAQWPSVALTPSANLRVDMKSVATRPFVESTVTSNTYGASFASTSPYTQRVIPFPQDGTGRWHVITFTAAEVNDFLGKWLLLQFNTDALTLGTFSLFPREAASSANLTTYDLHLTR